MNPIETTLQAQTFQSRNFRHTLVRETSSETADSLIVLVPEFDDYLRPDAAAARFASVPEAVLIPVEGGKHLWVGESQTRRVLTEIVAAVNPDALPLPTEWHGRVVEG